MKNKNYLFYTSIVILIFLGAFILAANLALAAPIQFEPNVKIPGVNITSVGGDTLARYIVGLYRYGASFAGAAAMFMLVFAGWQWLFAAGDSSKVAKAKDTINGVLIGLILLFGGYLLLSQISSGLVRFNNLELSRITPIQSDFSLCAAFGNNPEVNPPDNVCGNTIYSTTSPTGIGQSIRCIDTQCTGTDRCVLANQLGDCPTAVASSDPNPKCTCVRQIDCESYINFTCSYYEPDFDACARNVCFGINSAGGEIEARCRVSERNGVTYCINMPNTGCSQNSDCYLDENRDGASDWCCQDNTWPKGDECMRTSEASKCMQ